jgi:DNA-binding response OmpR family regulator
MPSRASGVNDNSARVGGARADFIASLGRKVLDAREHLALLEEDPSSSAGRDELRRRLHALGTGARLLHFEAMAHSLQEALAVLDRGAQLGALRKEDVDFVARLLDDLPALAWGEVRLQEPSGGAETVDPGRGPMPIAILVVGDESLAEALGEDRASRARPFECERTGDAGAALDLARAHAPDLLLVDADLPGAPELVEALLDDPLTDPVPIVVVGTFRAPEEVSRFVALGVARTLAKPVAPEVLRATCDEMARTRAERTMRVTLGEPTLEQLADRLADELRHALVDGVDGPARARRVPLGEGTEVLGALWGAIARVQEIITVKTAGAVRFGGEAPEGAIALAPSIYTSSLNSLTQHESGADRLAARGRGAAAEVRLQGRRVVVADDDPGVTWFVSDLLRTAGCQVHEALDGTSALALAFRIQPELVVSDILMPGIDGFALCRALRRDVALRDTPVILLSWKEDLLQRVSELGASAAAYMRKESGSRAILARVREVLRPRARIESRLRGDGEVRGRLDGLTPRLLLDLVGLIRRDARLSLRDATCLYEVEVRAGAPRKATRTASDGSYQSGQRALASLLGVGAGRFVVTPSRDPVRGELTGTLFEQLVGPIARARGALAATTGSRTAGVERIVFDPEALEAYLRATPEPTRTLIERLAGGAAPRQMLLSGDVSPSLLEDVLSDLAARGAIDAVRGPRGVDLLAPEVEAALHVLEGAPSSRTSLPPNARPSAPSPAAARPTRARSEPQPEAAPGGLSSSEPPTTSAEGEETPSSLEDAVMHEISDRAGGLRTSRESAADLRSIVSAIELRRRLSNPPDGEAQPAAESAAERPPESEPGPRMSPSIPPDAVVPAATPSEESLASALPPAAATDDAEDTEAPAVYAPVFTPVPPPQAGRARTSPTPDAILAREPPTRRDAAAATATAALPRRWGWTLPVLAVLGLAVAAVLYRACADPSRAARSPTAEGEPERPPESPAASTAPGVSDFPAPVVSASPPRAGSPANDELPPGAEVPAGFGLLEVRAPARAIVRIDGTYAGTGPFVASVAAPGHHEVRIEQGGQESRHPVEVRLGKTARVESP